MWRSCKIIWFMQLKNESLKILNCKINNSLITLWKWYYISININFIITIKYKIRSNRYYLKHPKYANNCIWNK